MKSIATTTFKSPINRDGGSLGIITNLIEETELTLELFDLEDENYFIEWDIPELEMTEHIGIFCHDVDKIVSDYDGVFEVPKEAIKFLEDNGFNCEYLK
jgi:hypothetical protein